MSGYWHIGQAYTRQVRLGASTHVPVDDRKMMSGQLLQINFAPVWKHGLGKASTYGEELFEWKVETGAKSQISSHSNRSFCALECS